MTACPAGHDSVATDYCDVCGRQMDVAAGQAPAAQTTPAQTMAAQATVGQATAPQPSAGRVQLCPRCGAARSGRFCEGCGLDLDSPLPPVPPLPAASSMPPVTPMPPVASPVPLAEPPATARPDSGGDQPGITPGPAASAAWSVVATADRAYYDTVTASGGPEAASVTFPAYCPERRFALTGQEMRIGRRSASRGLTPEIDLTGPPLDPGISRLHAVLVARPGLGWSVIDPGSENGTLVNGNEIATGVPVPLHDGDRIHLGAWTVITVSTTDSRQT
jgi:pSer/pThr/pTyr-binding forkhead associated (FHA) protein